MNNVITDHLATWTIAPNGIKKLRELILELAVRGLLVPQNSNDEPASELLKKIATEKARLVSEGEIKPPKALARISNNEKPFLLPHGWEWVRLGEILNVLNGRAYKKHEMLQEGTPLLRVGNLFTSNHWYYSNLELDPDKYIDNGDLIYAWSASFGAFIWQGEKVIYHYHIWKLDIFDTASIDKYHLCNFLTSTSERIKESGNGIAMIHMTKERMEKLLFPLPPIEEQRCIVAKVDELMQLCDQLEQKQSDNQQTHRRLVSTLLTTLTEATDARAFQATWSQIAANFDCLFTTESSIEQLKQTILQLAVMGKLVPQSPNDEPASELLKNIATEKMRLIAEGKIKKQNPLPIISELEKPFALPSGWEWVRLDNLALHSEAGWSPQCEPNPRKNGRWGVLKVSAVTWGKFNPNENKELPINLKEKPEYEVHSGDFLISRANTAELVARAVIVPRDVPEKLMMSDKIIRFIFSKTINVNFINSVNSCGFARNYYARVAGGTSNSMKNVSREQIRNLVFGLPPLAEQHRIVAKVDDLMTLCEQLKTKLAIAQALQQQLAETLVRSSD